MFLPHLCCFLQIFLRIKDFPIYLLFMILSYVFAYAELCVESAHPGNFTGVYQI